MGARGSRIDAAFRDQIRDRINISVTAVNTPDKTHSGKPAGDPNNNPFTTRRAIAGGFTGTAINGIGGYGDATSVLGAGLQVLPPVTSADVQTSGFASQGNVIRANQLATYIRNVFSILSRFRNFTIQKFYNDNGTNQLQYASGGQVHFNFNQRDYSTLGAFPGVGAYIESALILNFIDALEADLANFRATNTATIVEYWCHNSCHTSCHGSRGRR